MNKNRLFTVITALCICAAGCSNDTNTSEDSCNGKCESDQVCQKGKCFDKSEAATEDTVCKKTKTTCFDNTTLQVCIKGEEPVQKACEEGKCFDGECVTGCESTKNTCLDDDTLSVCKEGEEPTEQKCSDIVEDGKCIDGECVAQEDEQDPTDEIACDDGTVCPEGFYCDYNDQEKMVCLKYRNVGEACDVFACELELMCDEGVCKTPVKVGEPCGELSFCESYLCNEGICATYSKLYGECSEAYICPEESVCIDSQCVPIKGRCESNKDCTGDSYCCLDESCGNNKGVCLPYSQEHSYDSECIFSTKPGIFEAAVQCYWIPSTYTTSTTVYNSAIVGKIHNNRGIETPLVAFVTDHPGVIRIVEPEHCDTVEDIVLEKNDSRCSFNNVSLADFDGDGYMEIVAFDQGLRYYTWDETQQKHVSRFYANTKVEPNTGTFSIHDIDNDGVPEIVNSAGQVYHTDDIISSTALSHGNYSTPVLADLDGDGAIEIVVQDAVYRWDTSSKSWISIASMLSGDTFVTTAYADFGTPGNNEDTFDFEHLDGHAEIVFSGRKAIQIWAIFDEAGAKLPQPQRVFYYQFSPISQSGGYPPAIGDFNGDGKPEIGVASNSLFGVYDPKCKETEAGKCERPNVAWQKPTQDKTGIAGASAFDFDGDGQIEIVYGDECYTRVYNGKTGEVLFSSYRNSATVIEYPVIADVDGDGSTEIIISSDSRRCAQNVDQSHRGVKCENNEDCYSGSCVGGLCRCTNDSQCNWQTINDSIFKQYSCLAPLSGDEEGGNVCRAIQGTTMPGITILRDRLDRWVSSRTLWNQHAYTITNINDDGSIPKTSDWKQNFTTAGLNNFRQQRQGSTGKGVAPDITGRFTSAADACIVENGQVKMTAQVCNRGTKAVGSRMPAVFYKDSIANENILCVSYTDEMVPVQGCRDVSCSISKEVADSLSDKKIILKVNDDGKGGKTTVECNEGNNTDEIVMKACRIVN